MASLRRSHKHRLRMRTINYTNYALMMATIVLVLIAAHAKSAKLQSDDSNPNPNHSNNNNNNNSNNNDNNDNNINEKGDDEGGKNLAKETLQNTKIFNRNEHENHQQQQELQHSHHNHHQQQHEHNHHRNYEHEHQHHHHQPNQQEQKHQKRRRQHHLGQQQERGHLNKFRPQKRTFDDATSDVPPLPFSFRTTTTTTTSNRKHPYHSKFSIEQLLHAKFESKVSNDIDMDPCKAGGFMGDIALPENETHYNNNNNIDNEDADEDDDDDEDSSEPPIVAHTREWQSDAPAVLEAAAALKYNASFQLELEKLKQEVYHEGLQVEEEGMTDIIRKKTKLPNTQSTLHQQHSQQQHNERFRNDPVLSANEPVKPTVYATNTEYAAPSYKNEVISPELPHNSLRLHHQLIEAITSSGLETEKTRTAATGDIISLNELKTNKSHIGFGNRNVDQRKIQSNNKDIEDDSGNNFVAERKVMIVPTSLPTQRTTLPNVYSNSGGNGMQKMDDVEFLQVDGIVRRRHRRGRKHRRSSDASLDYFIKLQRLREELNRPERQKQHHHLHRNSNNGDNGTHEQSLTHHNHQQHQNHPRLHYGRPQQRVMEQKMQSQYNEWAQHPSFNYSSENIDELDAFSRHKTNMVSSLEMDLQNAENVRNIGQHHRVARAVTAKKERIWDYGVIPYEIDGNFSGLHKALFKQAMRHWENSTCIKFVERDLEIHPNYIVFTVRSCGCCSFVGKRGNGAQAISIGRNCDKFGIVVHELGHVVGFWHEHTRPDREKHVVIERNNIMKGQDYNFNMLSLDEVDSLGMAYDYDSIMHYARNTFSKGTYLDTILPIEMKGKKRPEIGQRLRLSSGDISQANLLYRCPRCGRTFQENTGIFASPSYYTAGALTNETEHCEWRITATHGERVVLRLENLNILKSNNCQTDYLEVRDGYYYKSPLIGRFCGKVNNELLTTQSSRMLLTYVNKHRSEGHRGFKAEFDVVCGGELSVDDSEGRLESPNYPLDYLPNKECVWKITVPKGYQVALKFHSFEVENHDSCVYDYVEVRDGPTQEAPLIGVFCGYKPPPNMKSSGNSMYVKFVSDTSVQKAGFSAIFMKEVDECETQNHGCEHECINTLGGYECSCHIGYELHSDKKHCEDACGGVIEYPNGTITSPSFPDLYPILKVCIWEIVAQPKHKISLNFTHFDLEGTSHQQSDCGYDSVTIYSKLSENRLKRIGTYCGSSIPPTATSEANALRIEFHSDKSIQRTGFAAVFFTDIDECAINNGGCQHECRNTIGSYMCFCHNGYSLHENGHDCKEGECKYEISASFGNIYSPNYPDSYPPNADCVWHFSTTPGHRIKLIFNEFNVESHQECAYDNVAIYDGESEASSILGRFCGDKIPYPISSTTNQLYMVLKTDKNKQLNGFTAMHSTSCGGYLRATNQIQQFYSHARFGNHDYDDNMDCEWTIQAPASSNVQLLFLTFDIEFSDNCTFDYVQVFSGMEDTSGPMYGQYCGNMLPQDIISLTDSLLVRFKTDNTVGMKGFSASYVAVDPFENTDEDDGNSYSSEMVTPFPGYLKNIYKEDTEETDDYSDSSENQLVNSQYRSRNPYPIRYYY